MEPELFAQSVHIEELVNRRRKALGRDPVYLTRYGRPLAEAIAVEPPVVDDDGLCDSGWCMT
ncbi:hypothetical protein [Kitasatospora aureofaciens]|uniref:hypothetical protein n=1 Tax=Kitasatospora aureofaciens TaxID=1894 RepID=UPI0033CF9C4F